MRQIEHVFCFLLSVISPIDKKRMDGVPSIRVHHALDYANSNHIIRWTEVFILKVSESHIKSHQMNRHSENHHHFLCFSLSHSY